MKQFDFGDQILVSFRTLSEAVLHAEQLALPEFLELGATGGIRWRKENGFVIEREFRKPYIASFAVSDQPLSNLFAVATNTHEAASWLLQEAIAKLGQSASEGRIFCRNVLEPRIYWGPPFVLRGEQVWAPRLSTQPIIGVSCHEHHGNYHRYDGSYLRLEEKEHGITVHWSNSRMPLKRLTAIGPSMTLGDAIVDYTLWRHLPDTKSDKEFIFPPRAGEHVCLADIAVGYVEDALLRYESILDSRRAWTSMDWVQEARENGWSPSTKGDSK